jgi:hypothetical protein
MLQLLYFVILLIYSLFTFLLQYKRVAYILLIHTVYKKINITA